MPQSFVVTPPPPPGHSGELNTNQVLKTVNFPATGAKLLVKPPVWQGLKTSKSTHSHIHLKPYEVLRQYNKKIVTVEITNYNYKLRSIMHIKFQIDF